MRFSAWISILDTGLGSKDHRRLCIYIAGRLQRSRRKHGDPASGNVRQDTRQHQSAFVGEAPQEGALGLELLRSQRSLESWFDEIVTGFRFGLQYEQWNEF